MVEAVVFDIGNVLIEWNPARFYDSIMPRAEREALFAEVDLAGMNDGVDLGAPMKESVEALAARHPRWEAQILRWHENWLDMASPEIGQSVRLMEALQAKGIPVFALTNFGRDTFERACIAYPFLARFDVAVVSGRLGVMKPDPAIYAQLEAATGLSGARLLFTDDRADNLATAHTFGWKTHLFEGPEGWAARLVSEGLLSEAEAA